jgi:hypothetical protein
MTTIRDRGAPAEPGSPLAHLSRGVHLIDLVTSGVIRRARHELPVAASPDPGRGLPRPVAPHREDRCPDTLSRTRPGSSCP